MSRDPWYLFGVADHTPKLVTVALIALITALSLLAGCASTKVEISGRPLKESLCRADAPPLSVQVYWTTHWRPDQKEPELREAAALQGLQDFFAGSRCFSVVAIERLASGQTIPTGEDLLQLAITRGGDADRVVLAVVRELGPRLVIGLPAIVEGGTEVSIDVRVLDPTAGQVLADSHTLWRNGGIFVVKGVKTLESDMSAALHATLMEWREGGQ